MGGLCLHRRVRTLCSSCRPDPRAEFLASLGPVVPHRWTRETREGRIRRSELPLIAQASRGKAIRVLRGLSGTAYWAAHDCLYPGGSVRSREWQWLAEAVRERDGQRCVICHATTVLQVDHIQPLARDGENRFENLWTLCKPCHEAKTGRRL